MNQSFNVTKWVLFYSGSRFNLKLQLKMFAMQHIKVFVLQAYCSSIGASLIEIYSQTEEDWVKSSFLLPETGGTCSLFPLNLLNLH